MTKFLAGYLVPHPPILMPEVGLGEEKKAAATCSAMQEVAKDIGKLKPKTIVIISPHGPLFTDAISIRTCNPLVGSLEAFGVKEVHISQPIHLPFIERLLEKAYESNIPSVKFDKTLAKRFNLSEQADHGIVVPLAYINEQYRDYRVVAITYGLLSEEALYQFGSLLTETAKELEEEIVVIASGDLSHHLLQTQTYDFRENGKAFDKLVIDYLAKQDYLALMDIPEKLVEEAGQCGKKALEILLGSLDKIQHETQVKSYEGPFGVGYAVASFKPLENPKGKESLMPALIKQIKEKRERRRIEEDEIVKLARFTIESFVKEGIRPTLPPFAQTEKLLGKSRGVFVSIKDRGGLRGCMGTTVGLEINLGSEIISTAIKAASQDPRFEPITVEELEDLQISVDLLGQAKKIETIEELDPKIYGVIVSNDYKRALLLPKLEGINTVKEQLRVVLNKAGINENEPYELHRFPVERHEV